MSANAASIAGWLAEQDAILDRKELTATLAEFEAYLADPPSWSDRAMRLWRSEFRLYGVEGLLADDLIAAAKAKLDG